MIDFWWLLHATHPESTRAQAAGELYATLSDCGLHLRDVLRVADDAAPDEPPPPTDFELWQRAMHAPLSGDDREFLIQMSGRVRHSITGQIDPEHRAHLEKLAAASEAAKG
jgi:hypothetical protein